MIRKLVLLFVALGPAACSGGSKKEPDDLDTFCARWANRACNEDVVTACAAESDDACAATQKQFCLGLIPDGKYSPQSTDECLKAVEAAYSDAELDAEERDTVLHLQGPCALLVSGSAGKGASCMETGDCNTESGLVCVRKPGEGSGTCQEPEIVGAGFECTADNAVCEDGFYCDGENCIAKKGDGKPCSEDVPCKDEFKCESPDGEPPAVPDAGAGAPDGGLGDGGGAATSADDRICVARLPNRAECTKDADCESRICAKARDSDSGRCTPTVVLSVNEAICNDLS